MTETTSRLYLTTTDKGEKRTMPVTGALTRLKNLQTDAGRLNAKRVRSKEDNFQLENIGLEITFMHQLVAGLLKSVDGYQASGIKAEAYHRMETNLGDAIIAEASHLTNGQVEARNRQAPRLTTGLGFDETDFSELTLPEKVILFRILRTARKIGRGGDESKDMTFEKYKLGFKAIAQFTLPAVIKFGRKETPAK